MADISVQIDVLNPYEILKHKKGKLVGSVFALWMNEDDLRSKIEEEICKVLVSELRSQLDERLNEEGILAHLHIEVKA